MTESRPVIMSPLCHQQAQHLWTHIPRDPNPSQTQLKAHLSPAFSLSFSRISFWVWLLDAHKHLLNSQNKPWQSKSQPWIRQVQYPRHKDCSARSPCSCRGMEGSRSKDPGGDGTWWHTGSLVALVPHCFHHSAEYGAVGATPMAVSFKQGMFQGQPSQISLFGGENKSPALCKARAGKYNYHKELESRCSSTECHKLSKARGFPLSPGACVGAGVGNTWCLASCSSTWAKLTPRKKGLSWNVKSLEQRATDIRRHCKDKKCIFYSTTIFLISCHSDLPACAGKGSPLPTNLSSNELSIPKTTSSHSTKHPAATFLCCLFSLPYPKWRKRLWNAFLDMPCNMHRHCSWADVSRGLTCPPHPLTWAQHVPQTSL